MENKFKRWILFSLSIVSLLLASCSSDDNEENYGTTTGNYLLLAINNQWIYNNDSDNEEIMKLSKVEKLNGKSYYFVENNINVPDPEVETKTWFAKTGAAYFNRTQIIIPADSGFGEIKVSPLEVIFLRDDLDVNGTWTQNITIAVSIPGEPTQKFPVAVRGRIVEKDISILVNGVTYNNVIKSNVEIEFDGDITTTNYWFSRDVGVVKSEAITGGITSTLQLKSYTLN